MQIKTALLAGILMLAGGTTSAFASSVSVADLADQADWVSTYGTNVEGGTSGAETTWLAVGSTTNTHGTLTNWVFEQNGVYTYIHRVNPDNGSTFNTFGTSFGEVRGFNGTAGWDYGEAAAAGSGGSGSGAFSLSHDAGDGSLDWNNQDANWWDNTEVITFFYQSTRAPHLATYFLQNGGVATAQSFAPVPLPPAGLMGLGLLGGLGLLSRMKKRRSA